MRRPRGGKVHTPSIRQGTNVQSAQGTQKTQQQKQHGLRQNRRHRAASARNTPTSATSGDAGRTTRPQPSPSDGAPPHRQERIKAGEDVEEGEPRHSAGGDAEEDSVMGATRRPRAPKQDCTGRGSRSGACSQRNEVGVSTRPPHRAPCGDSPDEEPDGRAGRRVCAHRESVLHLRGPENLSAVTHVGQEPVLPAVTTQRPKRGHRAREG